MDSQKTTPSTGAALGVKVVQEETGICLAAGAIVQANPAPVPSTLQKDFPPKVSLAHRLLAVISDTPPQSKNGRTAPVRMPPYPVPRRCACVAPSARIRPAAAALPLVLVQWLGGAR